MLFLFAFQFPDLTEILRLHSNVLILFEYFDQVSLVHFKRLLQVFSSETISLILVKNGLHQEFYSPPFKIKMWKYLAIHCVKCRNFTLFLGVEVLWNAQFPPRNCIFPQNFHTTKLGEITVFLRSECRWVLRTLPNICDGAFFAKKKTVV